MSAGITSRLYDMAIHLSRQDADLCDAAAAEITRLRAALAQAGADREPTGWICRHKSQVVDAEKAFPGQQHDYLWRYTHGTRDMAACEGYGDFDVVRLYAHPPHAQREPLSDAQIDAALRADGVRWLTTRDFAVARAIERAHGITTSGTNGEAS